jgi:SOS response regulatory protein OraA/RecX
MNEDTQIHRHAEWRYMCQRAVRYLSRFPSSEHRFRMTMRKALTKRLDKADEQHEVDQVEFMNALVLYTSNLGYLDDERLAQGLLVSYRRKGDAHRLIRQKLQRKGIPAAVVDASMESEDEDSELQAANRFVEKKRLHLAWASDDHKVRQKALQRMARRGFSFGVAKMALEKVYD